jgi:thiol:disulfide interchange protein DsbD
MCWPYPERFPAGPFVIFGYAKELFLVTEVLPPTGASPGSTVELGAEVSWLACEEVCIPGSASLTLTLPVEDAPQPSQDWSSRLEGSRKRCPEPSGAWSVDASLGDHATLLLDLQTAEESGAILESVFFYPYDPGVIENGAPQTLSALQGPRGRAAYQLRVELWRMATQTPERARGVVVIDRGQVLASEVDVPIRTR